MKTVTVIGLFVSAVVFTDCSGDRTSSILPLPSAQSGASNVSNIVPSVASVPTVPATVTVYRIPGGAAPTAIVKGSDGALWFSNESSPGGLGRILPPSATNPSPKVVMYNTGGPTGSMAAAGKAIWFSAILGGGTPYVGRLNAPTTTNPQPTPTFYPSQLVSSYGMTLTSSKSVVWITSTFVKKRRSVGSLAIPNGSQPAMFTTYPIHLKSAPWGMVTGPDKAVWFTESGLGRIGRIDSTGTLKEYALPKGSSPRGITVGPDRALWFADLGRRAIGRITTGGSQKSFAIPIGHSLSLPVNIVTGPDKALWFTSVGGGNNYKSTLGAVGRMTTNGQFSKVEKGMTSPFAITAGPDGAIWVAQQATSGNPSTLLRILPNANQ